MHEELMQALGVLSERQRQQNKHVRYVLERIERKLTIMAATLDQVLQDVTDESTLDDSIIALLTGIKAQLDAVIAGGLPAATQAKVDQIFAAAEANKSKVTAAITANTPAVPAP